MPLAEEMYADLETLANDGENIRSQTFRSQCEMSERNQTEVQSAWKTMGSQGSSYDLGWKTQGSLDDRADWGSQTSGGRNETQDRLISSHGGYLSEDMITEPDTQEAVLEDVYVLLVGRKISNIEELRYKFFGQIIPGQPGAAARCERLQQGCIRAAWQIRASGLCTYGGGMGAGRKRNLRGDSVPDRYQNHRCGADQLCDA